jgi:hypothetical protein
MSRWCPRYAEEFDRFLLESEENKKVEKDGERILELIIKHGGVKGKTFNETGLIFDTLEVQVLFIDFCFLFCLPI